MTITELLFDARLPDGHQSPFANTPGYQVRLATSEADVVAAQRLRYLVFAEECGADTPGPAGVDRELFDDSCDHLIVWQHDAHAAPVAVATFRLFPPHSNEASPRSAGLYADREFGLLPLERLLDATVEAGRGCVHPDHRSGTVVSLLWGGLARYMHLTGYRYLLGCASMDISDGGNNAAAFWDLAVGGHLAPAERRCRPRAPIAIGGLARAEQPTIPPLLRGYLRLGAKVCGPPSYDEVSGTADFLVLLDLRDADRRYLHRFLGRHG